MIYRLFTKVGLEHFALGLQLPILVALPLARGLSLAQIGILEAILAVILFCFEIPSGYIADKLGRKYAMATSSIAFAASYGLFAIAQNFTAFIIPFMLMGIGFAMLSGADEAYLFDSLKEERSEKEYRRWYGRLTIVDELVTIVGLGVSTVIAHFIAPASVFIFAAVAMFVTATYTLIFLNETRIHTKEPKSVAQAFEQEPISLVRRAIRFLKTHAPFAIVLLAFALLDESGRLLWQPRILDLGFTISALGIIYAGLKIFSILGAWLSSNIKGRVCRVHFFSVGVLAAIAFALIGFGNVYVAIGGLALYFLVENAFRVFRSEYLNERIESRYRATFLSLNSFSTQTFAALFVIGLGAVADQRLVYGFALLIGVKIIASTISLGLPNTYDKIKTRPD
jgi:MFS family permease